MGYRSTITIKRTPSARTAEVGRAEWHERATALYEELRKPAAGLIRRAYGQSFGDAELEDVYSNAWLGTLRALERKHSELSDQEIRAYLLTAVANHAGKEMRRRRRKPVAPLEAAGAVAEHTETPEETAQANESRAITRDLLSSLPPRRRAVLLLRYGWELGPDEVCEMVDGLSPRAYRKEITKGVDDLVKCIKLVEDGRWCGEREPLLKAFASGLASKDEALQAERHISHCRSCSDFVGRLSGHLNDVGSAILLPGALEGMDGQSVLLEKVRDAAESMREAALGPLARSETTEGIAIANGARGGGAAGAGLLAKLTGLGSGAKAVLACAGGAIAASACVVAGVGPVALEGPPDGIVHDRQKRTPPLAQFARLAQLELDEPRPVTEIPAEAVSPEPPAPEQPRPESEEPVPVAEEPPLASDTPPVTQELGVESAAQPVGAPPAQTDSGSGGGAVATEFGP